MRINGTFVFCGRFYTSLPDPDPEIDTPHIGGKLVFNSFADEGPRASAIWALCAVQLDTSTIPDRPQKRVLKTLVRTHLGTFLKGWSNIRHRK